MTDETKRIKTGLILITYAVLLYVVLSNLNGLLSFAMGVLRIISPFLYGIAIAYILNILLRLFEKLYSFLDHSRTRFFRKMKRPLSILSVFFTLIIIIYAMMVFAIPHLSLSVTSLAANIPEHIKEFEDFLNRTITGLGLMGGFWKNVSLNWNDIIQKAGQFISSSFPLIFAFTANMTGFIINIATGVLISIYLLVAKEHLLLILRKLICAWLPKKLSNRLIDTGIMANRIFMGYFSGMIVNALLLGALCFLGSIIFGIPYAFLLSMIIALTGLIPIIGSLVGSVLAIIIVLLTMPQKALLFAIFLVLLQEIDSFVIYPKVVGRSIGLSGLWIIISLIIGGSLFGITGIIAGIPAFAVIYALVRKATQNRMLKRENSPVRDI